MSLSSQWRSLSKELQVAVIAGTFTVLAAVITGIFALHANSNGGPKMKHSSSIAPTISGECINKLHFSSPKNNAKVSGERGVFVGGEACGLRNEYGWLFDHDYFDNYYYEDYQTKPGPIVSGNGKWGFQDAPVGNKGDDDTVYAVTLVLASPECNRALLAIEPTEGVYKIHAMPDGCRIVDSRDIHVTWK
jgi:hypothetical protein